ncbi:MAG: hypothetical protein ACSHYA_14470 [Opitutaceae bacterium]
MATYSVRSVLEWTGRNEIRKKHLYEERITVWNAESLDEAIALAEKEEAEYIHCESSKKEAMVSLSFYQAYWAYEEVDLRKQGLEIFSLLRESDLEPDDYLDAFFDTGTERQQASES